MQACYSDCVVPAAPIAGVASVQGAVIEYLKLLRLQHTQSLADRFG